MTEAEDAMLFHACRDFVTKQSEGEWDTDMIERDARKMAAFIDKIRPARPKLNLDITPGVITTLDGMEASHDAWEVTRVAATLAGGALAIGAKWDPVMFVERARDLVAQAKVKSA